MIYGRWRRVVPRAELDVHEIRQREDEEAWDLRHEALADRLDTYIDQIVFLRAETVVGRKTYPKFTRFRVMWRTKDMLIVAYLRDTNILAVAEAARFELEAPMFSPRGTMMDVEWATNVIEKALGVAS